MTLTTLQNVDVLNTDVRAYLEQDPGYVELQENISKALDESAEVAVVTASDVNTASTFISSFKKISKQVELLRKSLVQPLVDKKAEIDSFFKGIPLQYENELERLEKELLDFKRKIEAEAIKKADEERKRLEEEAIQKAIDLEERRKQEAEALGLPVDELVPVEPAIVPEVIPQSKKISEMNTSKVFTRRTKTISIINEKLIPREYLIPDEKKIKAERMKYEACNSDGTLIKSTIPGVEFTFDESVV